MLIFNKYGDSSIHFFAAINRSDLLCLNDCFIDIGNITITGIANEEYSSKLFSALKHEGKQWNPTKLRIEDIPQRKFKPGDKVKLKNGMLDIGKVLTVGNYNSEGYILLNETDCWTFAEDWLELYSDEPIVGGVSDILGFL